MSWRTRTTPRLPYPNCIMVPNLIGSHRWSEWPNWKIIQPIILLLRRLTRKEEQVTFLKNYVSKSLGLLLLSVVRKRIALMAAVADALSPFHPSNFVRQMCCGTCFFAALKISNQVATNRFKCAFEKSMGS